MNKISHLKTADLDTKHKKVHNYEYDKKSFISFGDAKQTLVSIYEIPPLKSPYPYHYHHKNEETFYIGFDIVHEVDVTVYLDSDKIDIWG